MLRFIRISQIKALKEYYSNVTINKKKRLELMDRIGNLYIPRAVFAFVASFWIIGLTKNSNPEFTLTDVLISTSGLGGFLIIIIIVVIDSCRGKTKKISAQRST